MNKFLYISSVFILILFSACGGDQLIDEYMDIPEKSWDQNDTYRFQFEVDDTSAMYDMLIKLRHNNDYNYSNIYFFVKVRSPEGFVQSDTIQYLLAAPEGKWLGDGIGELKTNLFLYGDHVRFPKEGTYTFEISQGMREEKLLGFEDIGLRVAKSEN
mgnify:CR=1 FL=1